MQAAPDLNSLGLDINSKISAAKTAVESLNQQKQLKKSVANSASKSISQISSQLDKIKDLQKRYLREPPTSVDKLLDFLGQTRGTGEQSIKYLRKKILEASVKIEPEMINILKEQSIKALGCSQEQSYKGITPQSLQLQPLSLIPQGPNDGTIYIPVQSVDFFSNLKNSPETNFGQVYYEKPEPSSDPTFKPFGGVINFPMNKQLYQLTNSTGRSLSQILGQNYKGKSGQNLFDIEYTKTNGYGVTGDFFRVILIDRLNDNTTSINNKVGEFISDYYSTINLIDPVDIGAQIVNVISGAVNISAKVGFGELQNQSKFALLVQRILGLCFDNRTEIDVSGISKIAELDGVDDSFYELNEIDLRTIDQTISNIQNGVMEFEDCDNVKVPVDSESLVDQLIQFRNSASGQTNEQKVQTLENILDSISQNPEWRLKIPTNFNANVAIDQNIIKKISLAIAAAVLTPKNLLPVFSLLYVIQSGATYTYNQAVTSGNTFISSANTVNSQGSNIIVDGSDFLRKWKTFAIEMITKINVIFLETLFLILKRDLLLLIGEVIVDIKAGKANKKNSTILTLLGIALSVAAFLKTRDDFRKCKSILLDIQSILLLVEKTDVLRKLGLGKGFNEIPTSLIAFAKLLPGYSSERAYLNVIEGLQAFGLPTGTLPDGSPNLMLLYSKIFNDGIAKEKKNEKVEGFAVGPTGISDLYAIPF
jgi:hypothetical protein